ncbi:MAG: serine/threonine protein kinase, partial [Candidatus Xenobia bacterium]
MLQPGIVLQGKYRIERMLGQGGMGAVYLATMPVLGGKQVAVKELTVDLDAAAVRQFEQEAQLCARLRHPALVEVTDCFSEGGHSYLVMLYIDGQSLAQVLQQSPGGLPVGQVLEWADQLCDVLGWLHRQQPPVIFRDLKP